MAKFHNLLLYEQLKQEFVNELESINRQCARLGISIEYKEIDSSEKERFLLIKEQHKIFQIKLQGISDEYADSLTAEQYKQYARDMFRDDLGRANEYVQERDRRSQERSRQDSERSRRSGAISSADRRSSEYSRIEFEASKTLLQIRSAREGLPSIPRSQSQDREIKDTNQIKNIEIQEYNRIADIYQSTNNLLVFQLRQKLANIQTNLNSPLKELLNTSKTTSIKQDATKLDTDLDSATKQATNKQATSKAESKTSLKIPPKSHKPHKR